MNDPQWMRDLDTATWRSEWGAKLAAAWATWAISRLPPEERRLAAALWKRGKQPSEIPAKGGSDE